MNIKLEMFMGHRNNAFKVYLLYAESICHLYWKRLTEYAQLVPTSDYTEEECSNVQNLLEKVSNEVLGKEI